MTIKRRVPTKTPNEVREEIAQIIVNNLVAPDKIRTVYDYRTMPNLTAVEASITTLNANPVQGPLLGNPYYDFVLDIRVKHDGSETALDAAETALNELARDVWVTVMAADATTYKDIYPYAPDQMPGAPAEVQEIRQGFLFMRAEPV